VPETANETKHRVGKDAIPALSLAFSGTQGFPSYREGLLREDDYIRCAESLSASRGTDYDYDLA
jgi:hypothetical protein